MYHKASFDASDDVDTYVLPFFQVNPRPLPRHIPSTYAIQQGLFLPPSGSESHSTVGVESHLLGSLDDRVAVSAVYTDLLHLSVPEASTRNPNA